MDSDQVQHNHTGGLQTQAPSLYHADVHTDTFWKKGQILKVSKNALMDG